MEEDGRGRVLVVDGGASHRCALLGDNIAEMGHKNGWSVSLLTKSIDVHFLSKFHLCFVSAATHEFKCLCVEPATLRNVYTSCGSHCCLVQSSTAAWEILHLACSNASAKAC